MPDFFNYVEEGTVNKRYEAMQDVFLSWTLRCAKETYKYAKKLLFTLLYGENTDSKLTVDFNDFDKFQVLDVTTKRQFRGINLLVEVKVQTGYVTQDFILNIENKWYTKIGEPQLGKYVDAIWQHIDLTGKTLVNAVIFAMIRLRLGV